MLQFLLILILIGYLFSRLAPYLLRYLLGRYVRKVGQMHYQNQAKQTHDQGEVKANQKPKSTKGGKGFSGGEYIDFEEVK